MQLDIALLWLRVDQPDWLDDCVALTRLFFVVLLRLGLETSNWDKTSSSEEL